TPTLYHADSAATAIRRTTRRKCSMEKPQKLRLDRRGFLKSAAAGTAALVTPAPVLNAQMQQAELPQRGTAALPSARALAAETEPVSLDVEVMTTDSPGSDFMMD